MDIKQPSDLLRLISGACDGTLTPADQQHLNALLRDDEQARVLWLEYLRLHVELGLHVRAETITARLKSNLKSAHAKVTDVDYACDAETRGEASGPVPTITASPPARGRRMIAWSGGLVAVGLAASLLLVVLLAGDRPADLGGAEPQVVQQPVAEQQSTVQVAKRRPQTVALMSSEGDGKTGQQIQGSEQVLLAGDRVEFATGRSRVFMTGGANLLVEAPVELELITPDHVRLHKGVLSAKVPEWAHGFIVDTGAMRVVDLGTTFSVSAESATAAEAQVLEGLIKVKPRQAAEDELKSLLVNEGEAVRVEGLRTLRRRNELGPQEILAQIKAFGSVDAYQPISMSNTGIGLSVGEEDPHWQITSVPKIAGLATPRYAVLCEPHIRYSINEPEKSQWISVDKVNSRQPGDSQYTFETTFDLSGFDVSSVHVIGQFLADNGIREIRLNDRPMPMQGWVDNFPDQEFRRDEFRVVEFKDGFREGRNTVAIDVWNGREYREGGRLLPVPNQMALRVEWQAFGRPAQVASQPE